MATSTIKYDNYDDASNEVIANSGIVSSAYTLSKNVFRVGRMVNVFITFHPVIAAMQNKALFTFPQRLRPQFRGNLLALVVPVYNAQSKTQPVYCYVNSDGQLRTANDGSYGEIALTELSQIMIVGSYLI